MTTIAYKDGIIAFDSRCARIDDGTLISDCYPKMKEKNGVFFFICGDISSIENLINSYLEIEKPNANSAVNAVVCDNEKLFYIGIYPDGENSYLWKEPILLDIQDAWGSGKDHALTAFDFGCSAVEAVKTAAKRDLFTGGVIRAFDIELKKEIFTLTEEE